MKLDIEKVREALMLGRFPSVVPVKMVFDAIDELEALRARVAELASTSPVPGLAEGGPYTLADVEAIEQHRGKPYARLRETVQALDDAKADAARLRDALKKRHEHDFVSGPCDQPGHYKCDCWQSAADALAATDASDWLAKHDAEVAKAERAKMNGELLAAHLVENAAQERAFALTKKCASLETQVVAATNDAARAELRAQDAVEALRKASTMCRKCLGFGDFESSCLMCSDNSGEHECETRRMDCKDPRCVNARAVLAASPDSDARLREVMAHAIRNAVDSKGSTATKFWVDGIIDEVLGVKP